MARIDCRTLSTRATTGMVYPVGIRSCAGFSLLALFGCLVSLSSIHAGVIAYGQDPVRPALQDTMQTAGQDTMQTAGQDTMQTAGQDTMQTAGQDTMQTAGQDTLAAAQQDTVGAETTESARAVQDSLLYGFTTAESDGTIATLRGSPELPAWARYRDIELKAGIIIMDFDREVMTALPMPDTSAAGDRGPLNRPIFRQGDQVVVGERMDYDLRSDRGTVWGARTEYELGYYHGARINAITGDPDYLTVREAWFTTCDKEEEPHYYFSAEQMKIIPDDKVIARNIRFVLLGIPIPPPPLPAFPFLIKSIRSGRQSGLLMPQYSSNSMTGLTLKDLGFYWAPSDFYDARVVADITELKGVVLRARARYALRYRLQGNVEATYNYDRLNKTTRWETRFSHNQQIDPTMRVVAQGNFSSSSSFNRDLSDDLERRLQRIMRSHLNMSKRFENRTNLAVTLSQTRYLDTDITTSQFPNMTFRVPRRPLFGTSGSTTEQGVPGGLVGFSLPDSRQEVDLTGPAWYENFYVDYNISYRSNIRAEPDTTISQIGMEQKTNLSYSGKMFGWLNLQPSFSAREDWYFGSTAEDGFQRRLLWNSTLRASTKLYGLSDRPFGINASFRHVVEPGLSVSYEPDFSDRPNVPTMFGGNPRGRKSLSFSLGQIFQMKRQVGEQERKLDLARVNTTASYNGQATGRKLSDVRTSLVTNAGRVLNLQINLIHSFYEPDTDLFQLKPIMQSASYRSSLRLDSATVYGWLGLGRGAREDEEEESEEAEQPSRVAEDEEEIPFGVPTRDESRLFNSDAGGRRGGDWRWNFSLSHNYAWMRGGSDPRHSMDGSFSLNVPKWSFSWSARYDVTGKELVRQSFSIFRDLHCWEARLQVVPSGPGRGYWFVIAIKEIPEIKYERRQTVF